MRYFFLFLLILNFVLTSCNSTSDRKQRDLAWNCSDTTVVHMEHYKLDHHQKSTLAKKDLLSEYMNASCANKANIYYKHIYGQTRALAYDY